MKYAVVLFDGMADYPCPALSGHTPMELAKKPNLDFIASHGKIGLVKTVPDGLKPGSDVANLGVLGYDARVCYTGRSPLEAVSIGVNLLDTDVTLRCNLVTLSDAPNYEDKVMVDYSAGDISTAEAAEIIRSVEEKFGNDIFQFYSGVSYRHCLVWHNGTTDLGSMTPPHDISDKVIGPYLSDSPHARDLIRMMKESYVFLMEHPVNKKREAEGKLPANCIWFWAEGKGAKLPNFTEHYGASGGVVSAVPLCHGIAVLVGLEPVSVPTATGEWDTDYEAKTAAALDILKKHDFAAVHLEGPDEATHNHDLEHKIYSVECLSERVVKPLCEALRERGEDFRLLILSDHRTFMRNGAHGATPVPFMIYDSRELKPGSGLAYSEANGEKGPFLASGTGLMPLLFEA